MPAPCCGREMTVACVRMVGATGVRGGVEGIDLS